MAVRRSRTIGDAGAGRTPAVDADRHGGLQSALIAAAMVGGVGVGLIAALLIAGRALILPPTATGELFVAFAPGTTEVAAFAAITRAGGAPISPAFGAWGWTAHAHAPGFVRRLQAEGALIALREPPTGIPLSSCLGSAARSFGPPPPFSSGL